MHSSIGERISQLTDNLFMNNDCGLSLRSPTMKKGFWLFFAMLSMITSERRRSSSFNDRWVQANMNFGNSVTSSVRCSSRPGSGARIVAWGGSLLSMARPYFPPSYSIAAEKQACILHSAASVSAMNIPLLRRVALSTSCMAKISALLLFRVSAVRCMSRVLSNPRQFLIL